jgi:hypothetical protein
MYVLLSLFVDVTDFLLAGSLTPILLPLLRRRREIPPNRIVR